MENTEELDIDIDDIGTILKSSRLKSKKSLEEISSELCIRKIYLTALEESDYETLPPIPYGVGYVRTYAKFLGLNPERAVKLYKAASQIEEQAKEEEEETEPTPNKSGNLHIIAGIIAVAALYGAWNWYEAVRAPRETEAAEIVAIDETVPEIVENAVTEEPVQIVDGAENQAEAAVAEEVPQTPLLEEQMAAPEPAVEVNNNIVLEFDGETWVELKDKNKVYFQGVFHKGDKKEIAFADNLFLSVGRPQNIRVFVKGTAKNILAKKRKMNIPLDSLD